MSSKAPETASGVETNKGQVKGGGPHLRADSPPVMAHAKPGEGADLPQDRVVAARNLLLAHDSSISEDGQVKGPVVLGPVSTDGYRASREE